MQLILGTSCHLPNGSGEDEFESLYSREIKPLVSAVYQFPKIQIAVHYSGVLLHWIERRHPELIMLLEELLGRKQAELLGGGFYEPMLPLLPHGDKVGQVEMLTTYLRRQFGRRPQGCWIPAPAWEQNLVGPLNACGMNYTFLEDRRFAAARSGENDKAPRVYAPCVTEDLGKLITVFPVSLELEKVFYENGTAAKLKELSGSGADYPLTVFPRWQPTKNPDKEYLCFFEELSKEEIEFTLPGKLYKNLKGLKRLYFYGEPQSPEARPGANPRKFLTEYPEANGIYAKMVYTRTFINNIRGDRTRKRTAQEEIWKAQDGGVFASSGINGAPSSGAPGLSGNYLRKAAYRALLEAEKITREKTKFSPSLSVVDFDLDGEGEYLLQDEKVNAYIKARGAGLFELDYLPAAWNYLDTFVPDAVSPGLRRSFSDYLVPGNSSDNPALVKDARFCGDDVFEIAEADRVRRKISFVLGPKEGPLGAIEITKTWQMKKNFPFVRYSLKNTGNAPLTFSLVPRICLSFPGETDEFLRVFAVRGSGKEAAADGEAVEDANALEFRDIKNETVLILESNRSFCAGVSHVSVCGMYQFTEILPRLFVTLDAGKSWEADMTLRISS